MQQAKKKFFSFLVHLLFYLLFSYVNAGNKEAFQIYDFVYLESLEDCGVPAFDEIEDPADANVWINVHAPTVGAAIRARCPVCTVTLPATAPVNLTAFDVTREGVRNRTGFSPLYFMSVTRPDNAHSLNLQVLFALNCLP